MPPTAWGGWRTSFRLNEPESHGHKHFSARLRRKVSALNGLALPEGRRHTALGTRIMRWQARQLKRVAADKLARANRPRPA